MFDTVFGLPVHALVVHGTVVIVPTAAAAVLLAAVWPAFRRWAGPLPLALSLIGLVLVPVSLSSGEALEEHVGHSAQIEEHSELADQLIPLIIVLTLVAAALAWVWWRERSGDATAVPGRRVVGGIAVLAVLASLGTGVQVVRIGHSGAKAAWADVVTQHAGDVGASEGGS